MSLFLRDTDIAKTRSLDDWPSKHEIGELALRLGRLFIYAAATCRFLGAARFSRRRLFEMLDANRTGYSSTTELGVMSRQILHRSVAGYGPEDESELDRLFCRIFGTLTLSSVAELLSDVSMTDI